MLQKKKADAHSGKKPEYGNKEKENKEPPGSSKQTQNAASVASSSSAPVSAETRKEMTQSSKQNQPPPTSGAMNKEMISILREINANINKQGNKLENLSERVDSLYEGYDYDYFEGEEECTVENSDSVNLDFDSETHSHESASEFLEPAPKKPRTETFKDLSEKYQTSDKVDAEINDDLAQFVNRSFRSGICEDRANEITKNIYRPSNCEALIKTRVNGGIWRLLKPQTQTDDSKMQTIQSLNIKASINVVKLLDKEGESLDSESLEWGTNALALLGQANKLLNNKRKESHKQDLDPKYYPLTSPSLPFTEYLYGDDGDINKNVKDIRDLSKIGRGRGSMSYRGYGRRRGGRRGATRSGWSARGRAPFKSVSSSDSTYQTKNQKAGHKK